MKLSYILGGIVSIIVFFAILFSLTRENRFARKGQEVVCELVDPRSTVAGKIVYEELDYIVVSGSSTNYSFTGGTEYLVDCKGCSPGVEIIESSGFTQEEITTYSDRYILKKYECVRQGIAKYKDIVAQVKMYNGE